MCNRTKQSLLVRIRLKYLNREHEMLNQLMVTWLTLLIAFATVLNSVWLNWGQQGYRLLFYVIYKKMYCQEEMLRFLLIITVKYSKYHFNWSYDNNKTGRTHLRRISIYPQPLAWAFVSQSDLGIQQAEPPGILNLRVP